MIYRPNLDRVICLLRARGIKKSVSTLITFVSWTKKPLYCFDQKCQTTFSWWKGPLESVVLWIDSFISHEIHGYRISWGGSFGIIYKGSLALKLHGLVSRDPFLNWFPGCFFVLMYSEGFSFFRKQLSFFFCLVLDRGGLSRPWPGLTRTTVFLG